VEPAENLELVVRKLEGHSPLEEADRAAIRALPHVSRTVDPATYLVREGDRTEYCGLLLSGFVYRHKLTGNGQRQILSIHMPGEMLDLHNIFLDIADHNIQALSRAVVAMVPRQAIHALAENFPNVGRAMWTDTLIDASIFREWVMNVGRRDSITRIAHLLCEFALRLEAAGLGNHQQYELPMTQEQLADAVGLTPVHVNRILKELGQRGLIIRDKRAITIEDWRKLRDVADFSSRYLHLDQGGGLHSRQPPVPVA
jgi:CRP-like cAMP-binding protein